MTSRPPRLLSLLTIAAALCLAHSIGAQSSISASTTIAAAGLQQDVAILRQTFDQLHPGLYRYNTKAQMDAAFDQLQRDLSHDQTLEETYLRLSAFTAQIRCGHTYPNFFNQSQPVRSALFERPDKLPFFFRWIEGRIIVTRDLTPNHTFPQGTEVFTINGLSSHQILARMLPLIRSDGANDDKRLALLQLQGDSLYESFDVYFPMLFPSLNSTLRLKIKPPNRSTAVTISTTALSFAERKATFSADHPHAVENQPVFTLRYLPTGAALLTMPTWEMYHSKWDWQSWLNAALDQLVERKVPALVIDLRANEGGDDVGNLILARLGSHSANQSTDQPNYARLVRYREVPHELLPYLTTWDSSFKNWGDRAVDLPVPWPTAPPVHYFKQIPGAEPSPPQTQPHSRPFTGKVFLLIDASNSSATFNFARTIQQEHLGLLVGSPTGGNKRGINGGAFFFLKLPNSGVEVDVPLIGYFPATPQPDEGLKPDISVKLTPQDITSGNDPVLKTVEGLISGRP